jgi:hypothetical protein
MMSEERKIRSFNLSMTDRAVSLAEAFLREGWAESAE